jgi:hypothetical protein
MLIEIIGPVTNAETIARGAWIRELARLQKAYGVGAWRKRKGTAIVRLSSGTSVRAEVH